MLLSGQLQKGVMVVHSQHHGYMYTAAAANRIFANVIRGIRCKVQMVPSIESINRCKGYFEQVPCIPAWDQTIPEYPRDMLTHIGPS